MKCPACANELTPVQAGPVVVDVCQGGCGGVWFDAFELQKVENQGLASEALLHIARDEKIVVDTARKRECPKCAGIKLMKHFSSPKRRVQIEHCPNCAGYWLDAGELARIIDETRQTKEAQQAESAISIEVIRYLYRLEPHESNPR